MELLLILILVIAIFIVGIYFSLGERIKRAIKKFPTRRIADIKDGEFARLTGKVAAVGEIMTAPLSGRRCVYYSVSVLESHKRSRWIVLEEEMMADVVLFDGSGYAVLKTDEPIAHLMEDRNYHSGFWREAEPRLKAFLRKYHQDDAGVMFNRNLEYREGVLEPNEEFTVIGTCHWEPASEHGLKIADKNVLVITTSEKGDLLLTDHKPTVLQGKIT